MSSLSYWCGAHFLNEALVFFFWAQTNSILVRKRVHTLMDAASAPKSHGERNTRYLYIYWGHKCAYMTIVMWYEAQKKKNSADFHIENRLWCYIAFTQNRKNACKGCVFFGADLPFIYTVWYNTRKKKKPYLWTKIEIYTYWNISGVQIFRGRMWLGCLEFVTGRSAKGCRGVNFKILLRKV